MVKNASLIKKKRSRLGVSPIHERLYRTNLECRDFMSKILPEKKKIAAFAPKLSTHSNNLSIDRSPNLAEFLVNTVDKNP